MKKALIMLIVATTSIYGAKGNHLYPNLPSTEYVEMLSEVTYRISTGYLQHEGTKMALSRSLETLSELLAGLKGQVKTLANAGVNLSELQQNITTTSSMISALLKNPNTAMLVTRCRWNRAEMETLKAQISTHLDRESIWEDDIEPSDWELYQFRELDRIEAKQRWRKTVS